MNACRYDCCSREMRHWAWIIRLFKVDFGTLSSWHCTSISTSRGDREGSSWTGWAAAKALVRVPWSPSHRSLESFWQHIFSFANARCFYHPTSNAHNHHHPMFPSPPSWLLHQISSMNDLNKFVSSSFKMLALLTISMRKYKFWYLHQSTL